MIRHLRYILTFFTQLRSFIFFVREASSTPSWGLSIINMWTITPHSDDGRLFLSHFNFQMSIICLQTCCMNCKGNVKAFGNIYSIPWRPKKDREIKILLHVFISTSFLCLHWILLLPAHSTANDNHVCGHWNEHKVRCSHFSPSWFCMVPGDFC